VIFDRSSIVSSRRFLFGDEASKFDVAIVDAEVRTPRFLFSRAARVECDSLEVTDSRVAVASVLRLRTNSKIAAPIIKGIAIPMINSTRIANRQVEEKSRQLNLGSGTTDRAPIAIRVSVSVPAELPDTLAIGVIDQRHPTLR
jgi:hypothetical protein